MWIRSNSHSGNVRSEDPRGCIVLSSQQLLIFFLPAYGGLCPGSWALASSVVYLMCVQVLFWRVLVPNTLELVHTNTWDETHICYLVKLLPLMFWVWVKVFLVLLALCLFFLLFSDKRNQAKTLVFQNKYPDWMAHKLHMVCIIDLFSWELAKKNCWSQGRPSLISPQCQGCLRHSTCRLLAFLLLDFVSFHSFLSRYAISPFPGCGSAVESWWLFILRIRDESPDSGKYKWRRGQWTHAGCDPASQSLSCLAAGAETSWDCANRADPSSCGTWMSLRNECYRHNPRSPPSR